MIEITNLRPAILNEEDHTYTDENGVKARFSISQIANRGVSLPEIKHIKDAALTGTHTHKLLHKIIKQTYEELGKQKYNNCFNFRACFERVRTLENAEDREVACGFLSHLEALGVGTIESLLAEVPFMVDFNGVPVAGTPDLILYTQGEYLSENTGTIVIDFKTAKMGGFKKEHHLQLYGYYLVRGTRHDLRAYVCHPEGCKLLFEDEAPEWIAEEFEDNFNYLLSMDEPKEVLSINQTHKTYYEQYAQALQDLKAEKAQLNAQVRALEKQENMITDMIYQEIEALGLNESNIVQTDELEIRLQKSRRHALTYKPELEKYYDCSVSEEYVLTFKGKDVKIKRKEVTND